MRRVDLEKNDCIDDDFDGLARLAVLQQTVDEECRFDESKELLKTLDDLKFELKVVKEQAEAANARHKAELLSKDSKITSLNDKIGHTKTENENMNRQFDECKSDKAELKAEKLQLKSEIQSEKVQCQQQTSLFRELQVKLESQWNETCVAETRDLRSNYNSKLKENGELLDNLQKKNEEINEKNEKIETLTKKIDFLMNNV